MNLRQLLRGVPWKFEQKQFFRAGKNFLRVLTIALLSASLGTLCMLSAAIPWFGLLELQIHEYWLRKLPVAENSHIIVVKIDDQTYSRLVAKLIRGKVPRHFHAQLIDSLKKVGAKVLVLDLLLSESSAPDEDAELKRALSRSDPLKIVLPYKLYKLKNEPMAQSGKQLWFEPPVVLPSPIPDNIYPAHPIAFDPGGLVIGAYLLLADQSTGRQLPYISFAADAALSIPRDEWNWNQDTYTVTASTTSKWHVGTDAELINRWRDPNTIKSVEYSRALEILQGGDKKNLFKDSFVLVGYDTQDPQRTPIGIISGVDFAAQVLNTLLDASVQQSKRLVAWQNGIVALMMTWPAVLSISILRPSHCAASLIALFVAAFAIPGMAMLWSDIWIDTVTPLASLSVAIGVSSMIAAFERGEQTRRLTPAHMKSNRPSALTEEATVLFVDLRGSTPLAEAIGPEETQAVLSEMLERLTGVVAANNGEVEHTLGDGLMAVFRGEAPGHHSLRATTAARAMQESVSGVREYVGKQHNRPLDLVVGLESGMVSGARVHVTDQEGWHSFGATVNLAARLQSECASFDTSILMGPGTWSLVRSKFRTKYLGRVTLKGISDAIPVYCFEDRISEAGAKY